MSKVSKIDELQSELSKVLAEKDTLIENIRVLEQDKQKLKEGAKIFALALEEALDNNTILDKQIHQQEADAEKAKLELSKLREGTRQKKGSTVSNDNVLKAEIIKLREELSQLGMEKDSFVEKIAHLEKEKANLHAALDSLNRKVEDQKENKPPNVKDSFKDKSKSMDNDILVHETSRKVGLRRKLQFRRRRYKGMKHFFFWRKKRTYIPAHDEN